MKFKTLNHFSNAAMVIVFATAPVFATEPTALNWAKIAKQDIEAAYLHTAENHPGMVDAANPSFSSLLNSAKANALALAERVSSPQGYVAAIGRFNVTLADGHAGAFTRLPEDLQVVAKWPGFSAVWRGDKLVVNYSELDNIQSGLQVISCDAQPVAELLRQRVFQFKGQVQQPGHWWRYGHQLLIDEGNPFVTPLSACVLALPNGLEFTQKLTWSAQPEQAQQSITNALNGDRLPVGLHWRDDMAWVAMPTFGPNHDEVQLYENLFTDLATQQDKLQQAKAVVLDLRHNQGGSSYWGAKVAKGLWGEAPVEQLSNARSAAIEVWWRASAGNTNYMTDLIEYLEAQGQPALVPWIQKVRQGMQQAGEQGQEFYIEKDDKPSMATPDETLETSTFTTPVYVIVPSQCASACLDALDRSEERRVGKDGRGRVG